MKIFFTEKIKIWLDDDPVQIKFKNNLEELLSRKIMKLNRGFNMAILC